MCEPKNVSGPQRNRVPTVVFLPNYLSLLKYRGVWAFLNQKKKEKREKRKRNPNKKNPLNSSIDINNEKVN